MSASHLALSVLLVLGGMEAKIKMMFGGEY
jgi:hypothetical protein